jgi:hypothetical protein
MKIGVCAIMKNENQYLEEWINHYSKIGVDKIFIYDNLSKIPLKQTLSEINHKINVDVDIKLWEDIKFKSQSRAYLDCAKNNKDFDFIGFFDADEFYMSKKMDIKQDIQDLKNKYKDFNALGVYWRIYGNIDPFETKQPIENYKMWFGDKHIKSWINPKVLLDFPDPHKGKISIGNYIDELGRKIISPIGNHTSENMWIKHIFTRSKEEWEEKMERGDANLRRNIRTWNDFYNFNKLCINSN